MSVSGLIGLNKPGAQELCKSSCVEGQLRKVIQRLKVEIIAVDEDVARKYAIINAGLVRKGKKIPINDVWIVACCMQVGGALLTRERHFENVEQIEAIFLRT